MEHRTDYTQAVRAGKAEAAGDPDTYFVDDESSEALFLGYSVAALRLRRQVASLGVPVDAGHPLFVYLPCGVGGAPGGIAFGLKQVYGDDVHCFFAEPVESPCVLLGLLADSERPVSVYDIGLRNDTAADGLAVGTASALVMGLVRRLVSGCYTIPDEALFGVMRDLDETEGLRVEPSAAAGLLGPRYLLESEDGKRYLDEHGLTDRLEDGHHVLWTTGGLYVPPGAGHGVRPPAAGG